MQDKKSLQDSVRDILRQFPELIMETPEEGTVRIRGGRPGADFVPEALVGVYTHQAFLDGDITEEDIREDCEAFLKD